MKSSTHRKTHGSLCTVLLRKVNQSLHTADFTGHYDLLRRVVVRRNDETSAPSSDLAQRFDRVVQLSKNCGHGAWSRNARLVHQLPPPPHEAGSVRKRRGASGMIRGMLAKRVTCRCANQLGEMVLHYRPRCSAVCPESWLRVQGCGEVFGRSVEAELAERHRERIIHFLEHPSRFRKAVGEVFPHSGLLRSLAGE